jgi:hypothetical protein
MASSWTPLGRTGGGSLGGDSRDFMVSAAAKA